MLGKLKVVIKKVMERCGYKIVPLSLFDPIVEEEFGHIYKKCKEYTKTTKERMYVLYKAVRYVVDANIPGDFVECGVWRGGSAMIIAYTLREIGVSDRKIYLYDTFEGMSEPTERDFELLNPTNTATHKWKKNQSSGYNQWCFASLLEVKENMHMTGYPMDNIVFVKGKVEDTIPKHVPTTISLLRLDTDWYESTKHELVHLYPLITKHGVLIIDDYGCWAGSKKAVDEYFFGRPILLNRIDSSGRVGIKIE